MRVTRTNESMHHSFMKAVNQEHEALIDAITGGDRAGARRAAIRHMVNAAQRIEKADPGAKRPCSSCSPQPIEILQGTDWQ